MQKLLIVSSVNQTPEEELEAALRPLITEGYRIMTATTALAPHGVRSVDHERWAQHVYYVTTVVLEAPNKEG